MYEREAFEAAYKHGQRAIEEAVAEMKKYAAANGFAPLDRANALALIDELKARGVQSFEGLGIKVML